MKKITLLLVCIFVAFGFALQAQKPFAGNIIMLLDVEGVTDPNVKKSFPQEFQLSVLGNKTRMDIQGIFTIITNGDNMTITKIVDVAALGMTGVYFQIDTIHMDNSKMKIDIKEIKDEKMTVAGYECYKTEIKVTDLEDDSETEMICYLSPTFIPDFINPQLPGVKGYPMITKTKVSRNGETYWVVQSVKEVSPNKKVKPVTFLMPDGAQPWNQMPEEIRQMFESQGEDD